MRRVVVAAAVLVGVTLLGACSDDEVPAAAPSVSSEPATASSAPAPSGSSAPGADVPSGAAPTGGASAPPVLLPTPTASQTPAAPPGGAGDLAPVPTTAVTTLPPVAIEAPARVSEGLQVRLADLEAVDVVGRGPGQISGPGVAVTVEVANRGSDALEVAGLAVSLAYAGTEAGPVDGPPAAPVSGPVPAGTTVTGTYVFLVPADQRSAVTVRVGAASQPVAIFTGSATD